jgi:cell division topological specificity factor
MFGNLIDYLRGSEKKTASVAKERLQIILAHERSGRGGQRTPDYLPALKAELLAVIGKYVRIDPSQIKVNLDKHDDYDVLELNVTLPEPSAR